MVDHCMLLVVRFIEMLIIEIIIPALRFARSKEL
jgi:hypothetical protein